MRLLIVFSQDFLYYQEKLPEFDADEEVASLMCVIDLHCVAFLVLSLICHAHPAMLGAIRLRTHCKFKSYKSFDQANLFNICRPAHRSSEVAPWSALVWVCVSLAMMLIFFFPFLSS